MAVLWVDRWDGLRCQKLIGGAVIAIIVVQPWLRRHIPLDVVVGAEHWRELRSHIRQVLHGGDESVSVDQEW